MRARHLLERCMGNYLQQSGRLWRHLPASIRSSTTGLAYGRHLHELVLRYAPRQQYFGTFFLRNRSELELMRRLVRRRPPNDGMKLTVLACSKGAEVYSMVWAIRSVRPGIALRVHALDISREILEFAEKGIYAHKSGADSILWDGKSPMDRDAIAWNTSRDQNAPIFERMSSQEREEMFEIDGNYMRIKPWLKQGIAWHCADAADPALAELLGPQDVVVANRFLCHMKPEAAEQALRRIACLVRPGGYLFVSGVDLELREKVAGSMGWSPVTEMIQEVHEGDPSLRIGWPLEYWGLEPFCTQCRGWQLRYAAVFQIGRQGQPDFNASQECSLCA